MLPVLPTSFELLLYEYCTADVITMFIPAVITNTILQNLFSSEGEDLKHGLWPRNWLLTSEVEVDGDDAEQ